MPCVSCAFCKRNVLCAVGCVSFLFYLLAGTDKRDPALARDWFEESGLPEGFVAVAMFYEACVTSPQLPLCFLFCFLGFIFWLGLF